MVNQINKQTFHPNLVGAVSNRTGVECPINSKVYHSLYIYFIYVYIFFVGASVFAWVFLHARDIA